MQTKLFSTEREQVAAVAQSLGLDVTGFLLSEELDRNGHVIQRIAYRPTRSYFRLQFFPSGPFIVIDAQPLYPGQETVGAHDWRGLKRQVIRWLVAVKRECLY